MTPSGITHRIAPPSSLSAAQAALWVEIVNSKPADWFGVDSAPVLMEYVRAFETCGLLAIQVDEALAKGDVPVIRTVLALRHQESNRLATLARALRLTQQSRYTPQASATAANRQAKAQLTPWAPAKSAG